MRLRLDGEKCCSHMDVTKAPATPHTMAAPTDRARKIPKIGQRRRRFMSAAPSACSKIAGVRHKQDADRVSGAQEHRTHERDPPPRLYGQQEASSSSGQERQKTRA